MINSRSLDDLVPRVRAKAKLFAAQCKAVHGIDVLFTSTLRDNEYQASLYAQGRTAPGKIVTKAKPGYSPHNYGVAFDFVPLTNGKPDWNDEDKWKKCGAIGVAVGLEWGGNFKSISDKPHLQDLAGHTISDFLLGKAMDAL